MPTTLVSTGVQFPDNSIQATAATGGGGYALQNYVSPATWTKPAGLKAVKVTVVGAGGNGGAATNPATPQGSGGGGGGAAIEFIPAPSIPGPVAVTAGPGTNSFGPFCSATAGSAGGPSAGGSGGAGSGGSFNTVGQGGGSAGNNSQFGGCSILGGGASQPGPGINVAGLSGGNYGGGGSGGQRQSPTPAGTTSGGTGAPGIVIVEEFY